MKDLSDYDPAYCDGNPCPHDCEHCPERWELRDLDNDSTDISVTDSILFEEVERHDNCTVQVLRNIATGELSVEWWKNE